MSQLLELPAADETDCPGRICGMCSARNPQYEHPVIHCPGCRDHPSGFWGRAAARLSTKNAQLREQLADAEKARHDSQELGMLAIDEASKLRAQMEQRTAALVGLRERYLTDWRLATAQNWQQRVIDDLDTLLADLPDAPKEESDA